MYYIALNTGLVFRTSQQWAWLADADGREHLIHPVGDKTKPLCGQVQRPDAKGNLLWVDVVDFDCVPASVTATWTLKAG